MGLKRAGSALLVVLGLGLALLGQVLPTGPMGGPAAPRFVLDLVGLWLPITLAGGALYLYQRGTLERVVDDGGAVLGGETDGPLDRHEAVAATNWKRMNSLVLRRSLGVAAAAAGVVAFFVSLTLGGDVGLGTAVVWLLLAVAGLVLALTSRRSSDEVVADHTHRVSVRVPDLFSLHSFHVHLRQVAEDLGYVAVEKTSPGRGGSPAAFDEEVFLAEGGFRARKRPIEPSLSPFPEDTVYAEVVNLTTGSLTLALVGVSLFVAGPAAAGAPLALVGLVLFVYDYVRRTRQWAELYCVEEGTVYTPTANVHDGESPGEGVVHHDPAMSAAGSATELLVTVGGKNSVYFEDDRLTEDFRTLVERLDDVATENSYTVVDEETRERTVPRARNGH